jgi:hypothetical protein
MVIETAAGKCSKFGGKETFDEFRSDKNYLVDYTTSAFGNKQRKM